MTAEQTVEVCVRLLEEGTETCRPTQAIPLGNDLYKLLPTPKYNPEDEIWEFLPGTVVRCEASDKYVTRCLLAVEKAADKTLR